MNVTQRLLGIDYGVRRIGLAIGDTQMRIATPLETLESRGDATKDAQAIVEIATEQEINAFVVGLPLNMNDGSDSDQTRLTRRFADELSRRSKKPVHLHDERLTSYAADGELDAADMPARRRKGVIDRVAAQMILQAYLDAAGK
jgi:putative Holliday junction resolvase